MAGHAGLLNTLDTWLRPEMLFKTRNTLDFDQPNYSSHIVFSHIPIKFGPTRNSAIRSDDPKNPILGPNGVNRMICHGDIAI